MTPVPEIVPCKICRSERLRERPFGYRFNGRWLQAWECSMCGIIFIHPQPSKTEMMELYSKEYFEGDFRCGHEGSYFDAATLERLSDVSILQSIRRWKPSGRLLEVGCAGGAFLSAARKAGYDVYGVEFSPDAAQFARDHFHLNVITGELPDAHFPPNTFDVVYLGDVLEHLPDPVGALAEIHRITTAGGLLAVACPTQTNTLFSRLGFAAYGILGKKATASLPPYHLFEYRPKSLTNLLRQTGFRVQQSNQGVIPPNRIHLRGPLLQQLGKQLLQYPNYIITRTFGALGDRIEMYAVKESTP